MKKTLTAITMALVLGCGTVFAQRGIIIGDRSTKSDPCTASKGGIIIGDRGGIIIGDRSGILGGLFAALEGIIIGEKGSAPCTMEKGGIIIGDRGGIIIGD